MANYAEVTASVHRASSVEELFELYQAILSEMRQLADQSTKNIEKVEEMKEAMNADIDGLQEMLSQAREETIEWRKGCLDRIENLKLERNDAEKVLNLMRRELFTKMQSVKGNTDSIRSDLVSMCATVNDIQRNHTDGSAEELLELAAEIESRFRLNLRTVAGSSLDPLASKTHVFGESSATKGHLSELSMSVANSLRCLHSVQQSSDVKQLQNLLCHFTPCDSK